MNNPFNNGKAVSSNDYIEPDVNMLKTIVERIINQGQATAIVSEPCFGKTSLLCYIQSPRISDAINKINKGSQYYFQFIDSHLFQNANDNQQKFWQYALSSVIKYLEQSHGTSMHKAYEYCVKSNFDIIDVENLLKEMDKHKINLVLLIDEFDDMLTHPVFGSASFLAGLRSFSTRIHSLPIVIACRMSVSELNTYTQKLHNSGSPYFNHFSQINLGPFSDTAARILIKRAGDRFLSIEKDTLIRFAGSHPYFLQLAAHSLWEGYENGLKNPTDRLSYVWKKLCEQSSITLNDTWEFWNLRVKQLFSVVALTNMSGLLGNSTFDTTALLEALNNCTAEVEFLQSRDFITAIPGDQKYKPGSQLLAWWAARKLIESMNNADSLGSWIMKEHQEGILRPKHRELILKVGSSLGKIIQENKDVFLKTALVTLIKSG